MNQDIKIRPYKSSNPEVELRLQAVVKMFLEGYSTKVILRYCAVKFGLKLRQSETYIAKAKKEIRLIAAESKINMMDKAVARFENLYKNCYKNHDWAGCQSVQNSINKLLGLNAETRTKVILTGSISPDKWLEDNSNV